jgi:hypothetical protein
VVVVLGLNDRERDTGFEIKKIVSPLWFPARGTLATHNDPAFGEGHLLADLAHYVPIGGDQRRGDELGTYVALAEGFLVHGARALDGWRIRGLLSFMGGQLQMPRLGAPGERTQEGRYPCKDAWWLNDNVALVPPMT